LSSYETNSEISDSVFDFYEYGMMSSDEEYNMGIYKFSLVNVNNNDNLKSMSRESYVVSIIINSFYYTNLMS